MFESLNQKIKAGKEEKVRGEEEVKVKEKESGQQIQSKHSKGEEYKKKGVQFVPIPGHMEDPR